MASHPPPVEAVIAAKANDEIVIGSVDYEINSGPIVFVEIYGRPFKAPVIAQRITG